MRHCVIIWDNDGSRREEGYSSLAAAEPVARAARILANRTFKIADAFGSTHHWSRTLHAPRNHWTRRAVADVTCD